MPDGTYQLTLVGREHDYILWSFNVTVRDGASTDAGNEMLVGWFTHIHGHVFIDANANGKRDPGEPACRASRSTIRERDNSLMDQYTNTTSTDVNGLYDVRETYPLSKWLVLEAFNTRYTTTGISYRGENETASTTKLGGLVDLDFLPVIGLGGEVDWGVKPFATGANGGIAGTVSYDTTRNELRPGGRGLRALPARHPLRDGAPLPQRAMHRRPDDLREGQPVPAGHGSCPCRCPTARGGSGHEEPGPAARRLRQGGGR